MGGFAQQPRTRLKETQVGRFLHCLLTCATYSIFRWCTCVCTHVPDVIPFSGGLGTCVHMPNWRCTFQMVFEHVFTSRFDSHLTAMGETLALGLSTEAGTSTMDEVSLNCGRNPSHRLGVSLLQGSRCVFFISVIESKQFSSTSTLKPSLNPLLWTSLTPSSPSLLRPGPSIENRELSRVRSLKPGVIGRSRHILKTIKMKMICPKTTTEMHLQNFRCVSYSKCQIRCLELHVMFF